MSWKIIESYRKRLAAESGAYAKRGGRLSVCLVYPNRYRTAMSNLGFQTVYALFNEHPEVICERAFLPDDDELAEYRKAGTPLLSLESQRPVADFDLLAFSVSFESDYLHIPAIFDLAGIPPFAADRESRHPLVMAGGAALFLNPEPVAELMDLVVVGEAEPLLPELLALLLETAGSDRRSLLERACRLSGLYVPSFYRVLYEGPAVAKREETGGAPPTVERRWERALDEHPTRTVIAAPDTEFSDMHLVELSRGCPRGCRFCAAGFIYWPYRQRSLEVMKEEAEEGVLRKEKVGLVGAAVSDYRGIGELSRHILEKGGRVSVSSLRIDGLDDEMIEVLKASGHKTVALAPEGGSQRLRDLIGKNIREEQILAACDRLIGHDILNLKLYFIIGLPTETPADLEEMIRLVNKIRERVVEAARANRRLGEIVLSVNPFIPKPFTPFQWCGMEDLKSLEKKVRLLQKAVAGLSNVRMQVESLREAQLQAFLSRGDRRLARWLVLSHQNGSWKRAAKEIGLDVTQFAERTIPLEEILPWGFIAGGAGMEHLRREYEKAFS
ncbi:radical SAM protein [Geobacter sp. DSM 9736]|uniref:radical SAM protein n=1 Tax=Geobacter sp. DSM 9736 TaxID=1277350 RepID=UPI000B50C44B|nr:radical SAM protein [Geobacter sp. DSM 9736]SNB47835.1 Radical SAM superfamily enzyme YgiQ, UPF0313 family [Geobacter sp. DSM 9736]